MFLTLCLLCLFCLLKQEGFFYYNYMEEKKRKRVCGKCKNYKPEIADRGFCFKQCIATCEHWTCCYFDQNKKLF